MLGAREVRAGGRRRRPLRTLAIVVVVLIGLLVAADFGARAFAQDEFASQIQSHGFPKKPDVSIQGFPFLTQVASRNFRQVNISSADIPEGPVTIKSISAVLTGIRLNSSFNGATVHQLTGGDRKLWALWSRVTVALAGQGRAPRRIDPANCRACHEAGLIS